MGSKVREGKKKKKKGKKKKIFFSGSQSVPIV
jgi:hypothetical protein